MNDDHWKRRVELLETRLLEKSRECARQHVALGQLMDVVTDAAHAAGDPQAQELYARFEAILQPYVAWVQRFHQTAWALKDHVPTAPAAGEIGG